MSQDALALAAAVQNVQTRFPRYLQRSPSIPYAVEGCLPTRFGGRSYSTPVLIQFASPTTARQQHNRAEAAASEIEVIMFVGRFASSSSLSSSSQQQHQQEAHRLGFCPDAVASYLDGATGKVLVEQSARERGREHVVAYVERVVRDYFNRVPPLLIGAAAAGGDAGADPIGAPPACASRNSQAPPEATTTSSDHQTQQQAQTQPQERICVICIDESVAAEYACVPCGHCCLCQSCSQAMMLEQSGSNRRCPIPPSNRRCPVCRENIQSIIRIFQT